MSDPEKTMLVMGIPNCDTVKKARDWLSAKGLNYTFQDFKKVPPTPEQLDQCLAQIPWDTLVNRKGTLWRKLGADEQAAVKGPTQAKALALQTPGILKRPVVQWPDGRITVGFSPAVWEGLTSPTSCYQSEA